MTNSKTIRNNPPMSRRQVGRVALAAATGLGLAACGGGGGDEPKAKTLREVYDKIEAGMLYADVRALVGFDPYAGSPTNNYWSLNNEYLYTLSYNPLVTGETGERAHRIRHVEYNTVNTSPAVYLSKELP